jgi:hypothetical protein
MNDTTPPSTYSVDDSPSTPIRSRRAVRARRKRKTTDETPSPPIASFNAIDFNVNLMDDETMLRIAHDVMEREDLLKQAEQGMSSILQI